MKKYILLFCIVLLTATSCEDFSEYSQNPKSSSTVSPEALFTYATKTLFTEMVSTNVNRNIFRLVARYWTQTSYIDESNYRLERRKIPQNYWTRIFSNVLYDLKDAKTKVSASKLSDNDKASHSAQITVLEVFAYQQLVDIFGDIPYTQALDPVKYPSPAYDKAADIYADIIQRLDVAISDIEKGNGFRASVDLIYAGDLAKWKKFANSLKFKVAMRLSDVNASVSKAKAEEAITAGLLASRADNVNFKYLSAPPNTNPLWAALVQSKRSDYVPADTLVSILNDLNDPRRPFYFTSNLAGGVYKGGVYGANNSSYSSFTHVGEKLKDPTFEGTIMDYTEIQFLLAEAAERGYAGAQAAATHYNAAITESILYWGGTQQQAQTYLAQDDVDYAKAPGTWKEKIGKQFWIGMYNRGFEGWCVYRKYDFAQFAPSARDKKNVPTRYTYPISEQLLNNANRLKAATSLGGQGDDKYTKIFWDVN